ncbi:hypothetical protein U1Q18_018494 [Sarracenia purpurea var. burkii]
MAQRRTPASSATVFVCRFDGILFLSTCGWCLLLSSPPTVLSFFYLFFIWPVVSTASPMASCGSAPCRLTYAAVAAPRL